MGPQERAVLIVEDEVLIRMMVCDVLRDRGVTVVETASAEEALVVLQSDTPVDLVFTDVRLPGEMDGIGLVDWVRGHRPALKIIVAASNIGPLPSGAVDASFEKPYDLDEVADRIFKLLPAVSHGH